VLVSAELSGHVPGGLYTHSKFPNINTAIGFLVRHPLNASDEAVEQISSRRTLQKFIGPDGRRHQALRQLFSMMSSQHQGRAGEGTVLMAVQVDWAVSRKTTGRGKRPAGDEVRADLNSAG